MKKNLRNLLISVLAIPLIFGTIVAQAFYRFDVYVFSVNRHIQKGVTRWGETVNIIPFIFQKGDAFKTTDKNLKFAGYQLIPSDRIWPKYKERTGANKYVYLRNADMVFCNIELYVFLEFDQNEKLKTAQGIKDERGCL